MRFASAEIAGTLPAAGSLTRGILRVVLALLAGMAGIGILPLALFTGGGIEAISRRGLPPLWPDATGGWLRRQAIGLWRLLCLSLIGALPALAWTLPGSLLLWLAWVGGFEASYNKTYESAGLYPLLFLAALLLFSAGLSAAPLARAEAVATGRIAAGLHLPALAARAASRPWSTTAAALITVLGPLLVMDALRRLAELPETAMRETGAALPSRAVAEKMAELQQGLLLGLGFSMTGLMLLQRRLLLRPLAEGPSRLGRPWRLILRGLRVLVLILPGLLLAMQQFMVYQPLGWLHLPWLHWPWIQTFGP